MGSQLKQEKRIKEKEIAVIPANRNEKKTCQSFPNFKAGDIIRIIPEDNKTTIKPAAWAYGDHVLEDIMFGKTYMKCIILTDPFLSGNNGKTGKDEISGICGVCIDHGGDNYIAFPLMQTEVNELEGFRMCSNNEFQNYLSRRNISFSNIYR